MPQMPEKRVGGEEKTGPIGFSARMARAADSQWAEVWLSLCAFFNSFLIPLPAETLLLPLCIARPERSWRYASIATFSSVCGGLAGYMIGALAFTAIGSSIVAFYGTAEEFDTLRTQFNSAGTEWILLATISPMPYKLVTITSGVSGLSLGVFLAASLLGRFLGYFALAAVCWKFGEQAKSMLASSTMKSVTFGIFLVVGYYLVFH
jgi:membrane protein YqaA with SNARE-associated domain